MLRTTLRAAVVAAALTFAVPAGAQAASLFPLAGWWPMNEGSGQTIKDWSGRGNDGVLGATTAVEASDPAWVPGVFQNQNYWTDSALRFDGADDFVSVKESASLEPKQLTVGAWVRNAWSAGIYKYIVAKNALDCQHSSYGLSTGQNAGIGFYIADGNRKYESPEAMPQDIWDGKWHFVAGTFDGKTVRLYVDGVQVGNGTPAVTSINYDLPIDGGMIGAYGGTCPGTSLTIVSDVDGVQIWSTALPVDKVWSVLKPIIDAAR